MPLQLRFDPDQPHQTEAVDAVGDLFKGRGRVSTEMALSGDRASSEIVANLPEFEALSEPWLLDNLRDVQDRYNETHEGSQIEPNLALDIDEGLLLEGVSNDSWRYPSFTVEMETGTGKTYVFLRTVYELRKRYGFSKFVVVVPSIAIYEGLVKNFRITRDHFRALYGNEPVNLVEYDGQKLSRLHSFATSTATDVLVITVDSFNKLSNRIYKASEDLPGELLPYEYLQKTRPILILDEPQSTVTTAKAKSAVRTLKPLLALRYSATHRESPNLVYRLTPFDAYRQGLVKKIQVVGVTERDNFNEPFVALESVDRDARGIHAKVRTYVYDKGRAKEGSVTLRQGDDLFAKTKREDLDGHGYVVDNVSLVVGEEHVRFENEVVLRPGATVGPTREAIFRKQVEETVEQHLRLQARLRDRGIKVLSLFFIDRVASYVDDDGLVKRLFDETFDRLKTRHEPFRHLQAREVREGYFAKKRDKKTGEETAVDTEGRTKAQRALEKEAFELIMREKEQLLSFDEPVAFVFAHSALKEGWDNPNVFQICTLNQTRSETKKRQEIGRGLRLAVDQTGDRVFDDAVNVLTVVANESYATYAAELQDEYREAGDAPPPKPTDARRAPAKRNPDVFGSQAFVDFCDRTLRTTRYRVHVDTDALVEEAARRLNAHPFPDAVLVVERGRFVVTEYALSVEGLRDGEARVRIRSRDTAGGEKETVTWFDERTKLDKAARDERLRGLRVTAVHHDGPDPRVEFGNGVTLREGGAPYTFQSEAGQRADKRDTVAPAHTYPVPDLITRAAREVGVTRGTVVRVFRAMDAAKKEKLFANPEGFAGTFIGELRNALADHVAERITFELDGGTMGHDLGELFPEAKEFPQKELVAGGPRALYDLVQVDSEVEERFVAHRLVPDEDATVFFFKFPPSYKVDLPRQLGNYNPDWGIVRRTPDGLTLQLVRETKGAVDPKKLQFPHEKRKIACARRHFAAVGLDYRVVTDQVPQWWLPEAGPSAQVDLDTPNTIPPTPAS